MKKSFIKQLSSDIGLRSKEETKLFKAICFIEFLYFLLIGWIGYLNTGLSFFSISLMSIGLIFLFITLFFPFSKLKLFNKHWFFIGISIIAFDLSFFSNGGFLSPSIYIIFPLILVIIFLTNAKATSLTITFILINYAILFSINYFWPEISNSYANDYIEHERIISHLLALVLSMLIINKIFLKYEDDKNKAKESELKKEAFLANMSHLIRTPLNGINGYSELLLDEYIPDFEKDAFKLRILENAKELHHMIFNLIDLSIIQERSINFKETQFHFQDLINSLKGKTEIAIQETGKALISDFIINKNCDNLKLEYDSDRLTQLIWNFIENSIYYTNKGKIEIKFYVDINIGNLYISISDSGRGIDKDLINQLSHQNILDRNQSNIANPKAGMGILISKGIISNLGGKLEISSELNTGTFVSIELPISHKYEIVSQ